MDFGQQPLAILSHVQQAVPLCRWSFILDGSSHQPFFDGRIARGESHRFRFQRELLLRIPGEMLGASFLDRVATANSRGIIRIQLGPSGQVCRHLRGVAFLKGCHKTLRCFADRGSICLAIVLIGGCRCHHEAPNHNNYTHQQISSHRSLLIELRG
ncbi:MAG: hypothetical protein WD875_16150 [Pirellulales bacterium]